MTFVCFQGNDGRRMAMENVGGEWEEVGREYNWRVDGRER